MDISNWLKPEFWGQLLDNDFNRGYVAAIGLVLLLLLTIIVIRLVLFLIFHKHRCSTVYVRGIDGELAISRNAIESAARQVLLQFTPLEVRRILIYRSGRKYSLRLFCAFSGGGDGLPALAAKLKPQLLDTFRRLFGIDSLTEIRFEVESFDGDAASGSFPKQKENEDDSADSGI